MALITPADGLMNDGRIFSPPRCFAKAAVCRSLFVSPMSLAARAVRHDASNRMRCMYPIDCLSFPSLSTRAGELSRR